MAVVATGFFDGVHLGHRLVIRQLVDVARAGGDESVVVTFWPHPRTVLQDGARSLRLLNSLDEKKALLKGLGERVRGVTSSRREGESLSKSRLVFFVLYFLRKALRRLISSIKKLTAFMS